MKYYRIDNQTLERDELTREEFAKRLSVHYPDIEHMMHLFDLEEIRGAMGPTAHFVVEQTKICPVCNMEYTPVLTRPFTDHRCIQDIFPDAPNWQREQLLSGICSQKCWDECFSVDEKEDDLDWGD